MSTSANLCRCQGLNGDASEESGAVGGLAETMDGTTGSMDTQRRGKDLGGLGPQYLRA